MNCPRVRTLLGRPLRLAIIGGGPGSFVGIMHRMAAQIDGCYQLVAGVLSTDPQRCRLRAEEMGIAPGRAYTGVPELLAGEKGRPDGADVVAVLTPNDSHFPYAMAALEHGFHVICDKPMTNTVAQAESLHARVQETGLVFCLTHNYSGYPLVRQARAMVVGGEIGSLRLVQVEYVQGGRGDESKPDLTTGPRAWKNIPEQSGPSLVLGDIGSHACHLLRFVTGAEIEEVSAERGAIVPGRIVDDYAGALLHLDNGARGMFWVIQAAAGMGNGLRIRVSGTRGTLEWEQEIPQRLVFRPIGRPAQLLVPNGPGLAPAALRACRLTAGHPEGFPEAFANLYRDAAETIAAHLTGTQPDPLAGTFPTSADGLAVARFIDAVIRSSNANGAWQN
ncbi:MAG: Gfo/Idh/MocA family oxidoreductase [Desulfofustis sp.]|nr:Gfo/Idh/MocA family oxidoreductase [Desulfofustis sp.]